MAQVTDDELQNLYENFETTRLLTAVDSIDRLRGELSDGDQLRPPAIRDHLLKLHELAMAVVNNGARRQAGELFDLAGDLDDQISGMLEALEQVRDTVADLLKLTPQSLYDDEPD